MGRAAPVSASVATARSGPFSARRSEQVQQGLGTAVPAGRSMAREVAGRRVSQETGARGRAGMGAAITAGRVSLVAMLIPDYAVARPAARSLRPGRMSARRGRIGWPRRTRHASRAEGAWPRATRR
jgi:hypothetical protein